MKHPAFPSIEVNMHGMLVVTLLSALVCSAAAFATFDRQSHIPTKGSSQKETLDHGNDDGPEPNFHEVAQRIGKTVLRPGGSAASQKIHEMANIHPGDTVLDLSSGLGRSGIELAKKYGARVTITDLNASRLEKAKELARELGVSDLVSVRRLDMFKIEGILGPDAKFDVAQAEASLTHYPRSRKAKFFHDVAKHTDKFILHEICLRTYDEKLQRSTVRAMSGVLNIGFVPETSETWQELMSDAGYVIDYVATGDVAILNPFSLLKDEGMRGVANIVYNVATQPYLRSRMLKTKRAVFMHAKELGYITIVASKK